MLDNMQENTPSLGSRTYNAGTNPTNRAFVIEALILLAFLAVAIAIVLQLFATAGMESRKAHVLSMSEHLVTNAAESFGANPQKAGGLVHFDEAGMPVTNEEDAAFSVETVVTPLYMPAGTMYQAHITVTNLHTNGDPEVSYELDTKRYLSALEGGGA